MDVVKVNLNEKSYNINIGAVVLNDASHIFDYDNVLIISDDNIPKEYVDKLLELSKNKALIYIVKNGEDSKNIKNYEAILDFMLTNNFTRNSAVIALGGGMVGDLAGFIASTYMRGVSFINIPTTFLSMVDSSSGGKTAINYKNVKNIFGSFYTPKEVFIDISLLKTLSKREFNAGVVEAVKMAMTFDEKYYIELKKYIKEVLNNESNVENDKYVNIYNKLLSDIIKRSVEIKKDVVEKDLNEKDLRRVLNFGHTLGHAIEENSNNESLHGECVIRGMYAISEDSIRDEIRDIMDYLHIELKIDFDVNKAIDSLKHDKKGISKDKIAVVKVDTIGSFKIVEEDIKTLEEKLIELKK